MQMSIIHVTKGPGIVKMFKQPGHQDRADCCQNSKQNMSPGKQGRIEQGTCKPVKHPKCQQKNNKCPADAGQMK